MDNKYLLNSIITFMKSIKISKTQKLYMTDPIPSHDFLFKNQNENEGIEKNLAVVSNGGFIAGLINNFNSDGSKKVTID